MSIEEAIDIFVAQGDHHSLERELKPNIETMSNVYCGVHKESLQKLFQQSNTAEVDVQILKKILCDQCNTTSRQVRLFCEMELPPFFFRTMENPEDGLTAMEEMKKTSGELQALFRDPFSFEKDCDAFANIIARHANMTLSTERTHRDAMHLLKSAEGWLYAYDARMGARLVSKISPEHKPDPGPAYATVKALDKLAGKW